MTFVIGDCEEIFSFIAGTDVEDIGESITEADLDGVWVGWSGDKDGGEHLANRCVTQSVQGEHVVESIIDAFADEVGNDAAEYVLASVNAGQIAALERSLVAAVMHWMRSVGQIPETFRVRNSENFSLGTEFTLDENGNANLTDAGREIARSIKGDS